MKATNKSSNIFDPVVSVHSLVHSFAPQEPALVPGLILGIGALLLRELMVTEGYLS